MIEQRLIDVPPTATTTPATLTTTPSEVDGMISGLFPSRVQTPDVTLLQPDVTLLQADATKRSVLAASSIDMTVTSPPYNVGKPYSGHASDDLLSYTDYASFTRQWLANCYYWTRPTGRLCVNVAMDTNNGGKHPLTADITTIALKVGWKYHATISWYEGNISRRTAWGSWKSASAPHIINPTESVIVLYKDTWKRADDSRPRVNDITGDEFKDWVLGQWAFPGAKVKQSYGHKAAFPLELPTRCIKLFSFVGDHILDPFCGSGTTLQAAYTTHRRVTGIEKEPVWCQATSDRMEQKCKLVLRPSSAAERQHKPITTSWTG